MESAVDPDYSTLPVVSPAEVRQQGMSPNTAGATAATDVPTRAEDTATVAGSREQNVELRAMTVAVAADQSPSTPMWSPMMSGAAGQAEVSQGRLGDAGPQQTGQMNATQASWSMMSTRRATPVWIQRLGAFFHEMRGQQMMWPPSPMGSPPQRGQPRPAGSPDTDPGLWAQPTLLTQEQQEQLRRMEQRAPLLYGPQGRNERAQEGSSGGSTYEAVQDEVKRQLRGCIAIGSLKAGSSRPTRGGGATEGGAAPCHNGSGGRWHETSCRATYDAGRLFNRAG